MSNISQPKLKEYISEEKISKRVNKLAKKLNKDYKDKNPIFIGILNGSFIFLADLIREINIDCEIDFLKLSSYGDEKISSGNVTLLKELNCEFGMSEKLGPIAYGQKQEEIFLGREINQHRDYSESTQILIDDEIKKIVQAGMDKAERLLLENVEILHRMSDALLEREILDSVEIDMIMKGEELPPYQKPEKETSANTNGELPKEKKKNVENDKFAPGDIALAN